MSPNNREINLSASCSGQMEESHYAVQLPPGNRRCVHQVVDQIERGAVTQGPVPSSVRDSDFTLQFGAQGSLFEIDVMGAKGGLRLDTLASPVVA